MQKQASENVTIAETTGRRFNKIKKVAKETLTGYLSETTIHGFRYIVEGRNICEQFAWILFIIIGFTLCIHIILQAFQGWENDPVQTTIDQVSVPVGELPFPAITVCDTESQQMPRRNRWMFIEQLLNSFQLKDSESLMRKINPGKV